MSEHESRPETTLPVPPDRPTPGASRLRRFFLRHVPLTMAGAALLLAVAAVSLFFWASSAQGRALSAAARALLEQATGGRVEIATFHWHLLNLEAMQAAWSFMASKRRARSLRPGRKPAGSLYPAGLLQPAHSSARSRCLPARIPLHRVCRRLHQSASATQSAETRQIRA